VLTDGAPDAGEGDDGAAGGAIAVPAWLIVNGWPATVSVPLRGDVDVLAATVAITVPEPEPLVGPTVTQDTFDAAVQPQPADVVIVTWVPPPGAGGDAEVPDSE
jgi:hypothetical protein